MTGAWNDLASLVESWRAEAGTLRRRGASGQAEVLDQVAGELEQLLAIRSTEDALLSLGQAAAEAGYSVSGVRKLVARGVVPNAGEKGRPRCRRGDILRLARPVTAAARAGQGASNG